MKMASIPTPNATALADERENFAYTLSDSQIHREVVRNICLMKDVDTDMRIEIMMQSISDIATIFHILKHLNSIKIISDKDYLEYLEVMLNKFQLKQTEINYDPRNYSSSVSA